MIGFNKQPGQRVLELGCGENPHPSADVCVDVRATSKTHFTVNFEQFPWPIADADFDGVIAHFVLEHVSYRNTRAFLAEVMRILKPGGKVLFAVPNTAKQLEWIQAHPEGWDGRPFFESASGKLFGDNDYADNTHRAFFNPAILAELFNGAGFTDLLISAYGERATDLSVVASKPGKVEEVVPAVPSAVEEPAKPNPILAIEPAKLFDRRYFNGGGEFGGYAPFFWDFPHHENTARHVLARKPESVLELGCGRGYVLKRLQDAGIRAAGLDISNHCWLSRVADGIKILNVASGEEFAFPWVSHVQAANSDIGYRWPFDLCFSIAFLEHVPEDKLPGVFEEMKRTCKRGLHGITLEGQDDGTDRTRVTIRSKEWWESRLPLGHEVCPRHELEQGELPPEVLRGDGKVKWQLGSYMTMFHHGWINSDLFDLSGFANLHRYKYQKCDVREGIPASTGSVHHLYAAHVVEHLTVAEARELFREMRRVIRPADGSIRIIVPNARLLMGLYAANQLGGDYGGDLSQFDELNEGCANSSTAAGKLHALLWEGHKSVWDKETLVKELTDAGWEAKAVEFRQPGFGERDAPILKETLDVLPSISLYVAAIPKVG